MPDTQSAVDGERANDSRGAHGSPMGSEDEADSAGSGAKRKREDRVGPVQAACMYCENKILRRLPVQLLTAGVLLSNTRPEE